MRAHALLDAAHPDRRSWEWNFLASRLDQGTILQELESGSKCLDINSDATRLALCTEKSRITLIATDLATKRVLEVGGSAIKGLRFGPDGHSVVAIREDGARLVWDTRFERLPPAITPLTSGEAVSVAAFDTGGEHLVLAQDKTHTIRVFSHATQVAQFATPDATIGALAIGQGGRVVASADWSNLVTLWRVGRSAPLASMRLDCKIGNALALIAPETLAVAASDSDIWLVDVMRHRVIARVDPSHEAFFVRSDSRGRFFISGSSDRVLRVWTVAGTLVRALSGHRGDPRDAVFARSGEQLYSTGESVRRWSMQSPAELAFALGSDTDTHVAISQQTAWVAVGAGRQVTIFDTATNTTVAILRREHARIAPGVHTRWQAAHHPAFTCAAKCRRISRRDNHFVLWDVATSRPVREFTIAATHLTGLSLTVDGRFILATLRHRASIVQHARLLQHLIARRRIARAEAGADLDAQSGQRVSEVACDDHNVVVAACDNSGQWVPPAMRIARFTRRSIRPCDLSAALT